uniref:Uncharacterized protein n=1 Tax=Proboscia inermis TaxID=420281 RepID=A0A7S0CDY4_9STRA|mmetsp:Transcript_61522/g.71888  ORF Transcript_61522/g.71888 Transcript_61522/m.71888 type:complete len:163 (-) Transcript_61522:97-585(-)|eukprot:CAMPEP_0171313500 /NCGR_PEP_ID=MMETSP0816-20121228/42974_1 /TAXON_ID=420281 /ORGANISM="Proboscia inermis, Strain CCAP1064/1" /LENGTH=162 /DNA_ID=CAMNT_0011801005 /DNA_START=283 /DNA_END=771 /DNA_ORIENTATION=+
MDSLVHRERPAQREVWKRKIHELREDAMSIRRQVEYCDQMSTNSMRHMRERDELLAMRRRRRRVGSENTAEIDDLAGESTSLDQSRSMMVDLLSGGEGMLGGLRDQRNALGSVRKTLLNMGNTLGLSNSTMRIIERRDVTDAYLVFGGMVITLIVIYFLWFR